MAAQGVKPALAAALLLLLGAAGPLDSYAQPGKLVALPDGRHINLRCTGTGKPTVILEAGFQAWSFAWDKIQPALSTLTRTCSYDRAGLGLSDPAPGPRDGLAQARDLAATLKAAKIAPPYILVAHSAGAMTARRHCPRRVSRSHSSLPARSIPIGYRQRYVTTLRRSASR